jgi:hypothetical protein
LGGLEIQVHQKEVTFMRTIIALSIVSMAAVAADPPQGPSEAFTAPGPSQATTETSPLGRKSFEFAAGWPSASLAYVQPLSNRATVAPRAELIYGEEGTTNTRVGFGIAAPLMVAVASQGRWVTGLHVDPGFRTYASQNDSGADFLIGFPVGAMFGYQATPQVRVAAVTDLQMAVQVTHGGMFEIGPLFGADVDWALDRMMTVGLDTRFGPLFYSTGNTSDLSFRTQLVLNYRL